MGGQKTLERMDVHGERVGKEGYDHISQFVNGNRCYSKHFAANITRDHPLLQAYVVGLMIDMITAMASNRYVDARNERAVKLCREITEFIGEYPQYL